ncbi:MAG: 2-hydroxyacid dehydrogenase [Anaerolineae bacterium]|nr:2-hydroxyacid dehydrogenase [Anaerolineae bacterium]
MKKLKVLICGDLFVTTNVYQVALEEAFAGSQYTFEIAKYTDRWPAEPLTRNEEVSEFVGDEAEIASLASGAEIILTHSAPVTLKVIANAPQLKAVAAARGGPVNINIKACTERSIPVFYAPGSKGGAVAEFTIGLMLAEMRSIARSHASMKYEGQWRGDLYILDFTGFEMAAATVGLVGLGAIGKRVAQILHGFGSRILVFDPFVSASAIEELGCEPVDLDFLLKESDIVSLHARLTKESRGMLGERELGLMKPSAYLVNTARAELVQEQALISALKNKTIAGAALDVFETEPLPKGHPFYALDNITIASHLGGATHQASMLGARIAAGEVYKFITGTEKPRFCINPDVLN